MKYPKIQSLWHRVGYDYKENKGKGSKEFIEGAYSCPELGNVKEYLVQEKIDGMNIRIICTRDESGSWDIKFSGRTDNAMLPPKLLEYLTNHFTTDLIESVFPDAREVILFGEGYGKKIQSGNYYSDEQRFVLFDVYLNHRWWLEVDDVVDTSIKLNVPTVPTIGVWTEEHIIAYIKSKPLSVFAKDAHVTEGIVARAYPMMLCRDGTPIKFKLKVKDFK